MLFPSFFGLSMFCLSMFCLFPVFAFLCFVVLCFVIDPTGKVCQISVYILCQMTLSGTLYQVVKFCYNSFIN